MLQMIISLILSGILSVYVVLDQSKRSTVRGCVMGIGFFTVAFYLDSIFFLIMKGFAKSGTEVLMQVLGILVSKSILVAGLIFLSVMESGQEIQKKEKEWRYIDGLTIGCSALFLLLAIERQFRNDAVAQKVMFLIVFLVVFITYCISIYMYNKKQCAKSRRQEEESRKHEADVYLDNVENNYQRTRELWHDLKNHINLLKLLLQEQKYEELGDYLRIFSDDVDTLTLPVKSGNIVVDALLSDKLGRAKRDGAEVILSLCDLTRINLKPDEICGIFGNLLDNALEANREVQEGRFIEVDCREHEDCYYIKIRNATVKNEEEADNLLSAKTDKRNQVGHGLGLRSVERIVHSCGGELIVERKREQFTVIARLPR